ncbi:hypothetical protein BJ508DRAFT_364066 [Ascobolus immersus RN42]|uniref:Uncharacterized protein n=1 Tax=Ascobolus immersus RN42 TaxID=1160509 RepID=A0A3N4HY42_ASCIM|nr:hypothetical protein BJ508DRAFT_364066 [Ascobolus immersus RN42]
MKLLNFSALFLASLGSFALATTTESSTSTSTSVTSSTSTSTTATSSAATSTPTPSVAQAGQKPLGDFNIEKIQALLAKHRKPKHDAPKDSSSSREEQLLKIIKKLRKQQHTGGHGKIDAQKVLQCIQGAGYTDDKSAFSFIGMPPLDYWNNLPLLPKLPAKKPKRDLLWERDVYEDDEAKKAIFPLLGLLGLIGKRDLDEDKEAFIGPLISVLGGLLGGIGKRDLDEDEEAKKAIFPLLGLLGLIGKRDLDEDKEAFIGPLISVLGGLLGGIGKRDLDEDEEAKKAIFPLLGLLGLIGKRDLEEDKEAFIGPIISILGGLLGGIGKRDLDEDKEAFIGPIISILGGLLGGIGKRDLDEDKEAFIGPIISILGGLLGGIGKRDLDEDKEAFIGPIISVLGGLLGGIGRRDLDEDKEAFIGPLISVLGGLLGGIGKRDLDDEDKDAILGPIISFFGGLFGGRKRDLDSAQYDKIASVYNPLFPFLIEPGPFGGKLLSDLSKTHKRDEIDDEEKKAIIGPIVNFFKGLFGKRDLEAFEHFAKRDGDLDDLDDDSKKAIIGPIVNFFKGLFGKRDLLDMQDDDKSAFFPDSNQLFFPAKRDVAAPSLAALNDLDDEKKAFIPLLIGAVSGIASLFSGKKRRDLEDFNDDEKKAIIPLILGVGSAIAGIFGGNKKRDGSSTELNLEGLDDEKKAILPLILGAGSALISILGGNKKRDLDDLDETEKKAILPLILGAGSAILSIFGGNKKRDLGDLTDEEKKALLPFLLPVMYSPGLGKRDNIDLENLDDEKKALFPLLIGIGTAVAGMFGGNKKRDTSDFERLVNESLGKRDYSDVQSELEDEKKAFLNLVQTGMF